MKLTRLLKESNDQNSLNNIKPKRPSITSTKEVQGPSCFPGSSLQTSQNEQGEPHMSPLTLQTWNYWYQATAAVLAWYVSLRKGLQVPESGRGCTPIGIHHLAPGSPLWRLPWPLLTSEAHLLVVPRRARPGSWARHRPPPLRHLPGQTGVILPYFLWLVHFPNILAQH